MAHYYDFAHAPGLNELSDSHEKTALLVNGRADRIHDFCSRVYKTPLSNPDLRKNLFDAKRVLTYEPAVHPDAQHSNNGREYEKRQSWNRLR